MYYKNLIKSKNCTTHTCTTTHVQSKNWHTIRQYFNTNVPDIDDHVVSQIIATGTTPLLECIINHYNRMVNKHHQQTFTIMNDTHHTLHSDTTNISIQMATAMTLESIRDLIDCLKQNKHKTQVIITPKKQRNDNHQYTTHVYIITTTDNNYYQLHNSRQTLTV